MSSSRCLHRISLLPSDATTIALQKCQQISLFSTSAALLANPSPAKKSLVAAPKRGTRTLNVKKGRKDAGKDMAKRPAPGDRKAARKRIVLSNTNALEVHDLRDLNRDNVLSAKSEGKVMGLPDDVVDSLRAVDAFKPTQGWRMFRRPAVLMRKETSQLVELVKQVETDQGDKKTIRRVISGERMAGKSTLLLQGLVMAFLRGWVVINLPNAMDLTIAHTEYAPLPNSQPTQYFQEVYTANLLNQMAKSNKTVLSQIKATTKPTLPIPIPEDITLDRLAAIGAADPEVSWPVFIAIWNELSQPGRPPVFLGMDNVEYAMRNSEYLSADVKPIHAYDLTLIRHFVDHLSGKTPLPNGGIVLAATTGSNSPSCPALEFSIKVAEAKAKDPSSVPLWNKFEAVDQRVMECLKDIEVVRSNGLNKDEAMAIMEYYAASGMIRAKVDNTFVGEKWTLAGSGNIGELERASVKLRL